MAYDKIVDSAVLDASLTSIADAIRAKAGTSDKLAFPAGFAEAIAAIAAGGGLKVECGTVTIASDIRYIEVEHNLGVVPKIIFFANLLSSGTNLFPTNVDTLQFYFGAADIVDFDKNRTNKGLYMITYNNVQKMYWNAYGTSYRQNSNAFADSKKLSLGTTDLNVGYSLRAGSTYVYLIAG